MNVIQALPNASNCVNTNWNDTSTNNLLESGGSLFGSGTGNAIDCSDPLNNTGCSGYAEAYQTQQCNITQLYNESCPLYWEAYDDQQCDQDPQYAPFCRGYSQQDSVAFFDDSSVDYGFDEVAVEVLTLLFWFVETFVFELTLVELLVLVETLELLLLFVAVEVEVLLLLLVFELVLLVVVVFTVSKELFSQY